MFRSTTNSKHVSQYALLTGQLSLSHGLAIRLVEAATNEKRLDIRLSTSKRSKEFHRVDTSALGQ